jgi:GntR family transcriptional regulator of abcA and norABC
MPGLRIAYLEAPSSLRERFEGVKRSIDISSNGLMQRVLERFLSSGRFEAHVAAARTRYAAAYAAFDVALAPFTPSGLSWESPGGSLNLWLSLPPGIPARSFASTSLAEGCAVVPESAFRYEQDVEGESDRHVRVSFGSVASDSLARSAMILGSVASGRVSQ